MTQQQPATKHHFSYRAEIDGLRALAVIPVILFHAGFEWMSGGYVGVDVFFVISGFLITSIILKEKQQGDFSLTAFYERRARRILPALFTVMACCLPLAWLLMTPGQLVDFSHSLIAVPLFVANILFWRTSDYFAPNADEQPLLHIWSLGVEEQYYLVFPLALILLWRLGLARTVQLIALAAIASLALSEWSWRHAATANFYLPHTRAWELLLGSLLALLTLQRPLHERIASKLATNLLGAAGLALILVAIFAYDNNTPFPSLYALVPTLGTALILAFGQRDSWVGRLLSARWIVAVGLVSYSAYLWHQPLFAFARLQDPNTPPSRIFALLTVLTLVLAWLSWRFVEQPFRNRTTYSRRRIFALAAGGSLLFIAIGIGGHLSNGFENRVSGQVQALFHELRHDKRALCGKSAGRNVAPATSVCNRGDPTQPVTIAVLGDSHADALYSRLGDLFASHHINATLLTYSGCPPVMDIFRADEDSSHRCPQYNQAVFDLLAGDASVDTVILAARWPLYMESHSFDNGEGGVEPAADSVLLAPTGSDTRWQGDDALRQGLIAARIKSSIERYLDAGKTVILVYPVPEVGWHAPNLMAHYLKNDTELEHGFSTDYRVIADRNRRANAALDSVGDHPRLFRIRPESIFCNTWRQDRCIFALDGKLLYFDEDHLSLFGSDFVVDSIAPLLEHAKP